MIDICEGEIYIDEKDTKRVSLEELRSNLAIIPQDPVLFTGTIRSGPPSTSTIAINWTDKRI